MIVDSMSWKDIADELLADMIESNVVGKSTIWIREKHQRYLKAYGDRKVCCRFKEFSLKSVRNNRFYIVPVALNKTSLKINGASKIYIVFFPYRNGMCVCTLGTNGRDKIMPDFYLPHFFDRYKERFGSDEFSEEFKTTVFDFLLHNVHTTTERVPDSKYGEDAIFTRCKDGIMLGHEYGNIHLYKTFVTEEMLFDDQLAISSDLSKRLAGFIERSEKKSYIQQEKLSTEEIELCDRLKEVLIEKFGSNRIPKKYISNKI